MLLSPFLSSFLPSFPFCQNHFGGLPSSIERAVAAATNSSTTPLKPSLSIVYNAAYVVPFGEVTAFVSSSGVPRFYSTILAEPSTVWVTKSSATL